MGRRQLFIRLAGCRQRCQYCDTKRGRIPKPDTWAIRIPPRIRRLNNPVAIPGLVQEIKSLVLALGPIHSIAITGGEPLEQPEFLVKLARSLKKSMNKTKILLETNGLENTLNIKQIGIFDFVSLDFKLASATKQSADFTRHYRVLKKFPQKQGCIKMVIMPETSKREIAKAAALAYAVKPGWDLIIQPATGAAWKSPSGRKTLEMLMKTVIRKHPQVRLLPQIHPVLGIK